MASSGFTFSAGWRRSWSFAATLVTSLAVLGCPPPDEAAFAEQRQQMVRTQLADSRGGLVQPVRNPRVLRAMGTVPRHRFVPAEVARYAYADYPLPIGHGQTISQPYVVARMTELVEPRPEHRVLEVGTGSGYQAAVLAQLVAEVYTIEIVEPLGLQAKQLLEGLGHTNVHVRIGDGYLGWPEAAPFDAIVVTAGTREVPPPLVEQLKPGGRMVIPVGRTAQSQTLLLVSKSKKPPYEVRTEEVMAVAFVPLVRSPDRTPDKE
jgi:protein-L-isoaspartate(D-aspartate) O-methyltransferase